MNWINDFWNVMWPVFAGAGSLMLAFAIMFAFIVMPVVLLRVAWVALSMAPDSLRLRQQERVRNWDQAGLESMKRWLKRESADDAQAVEVAGAVQEPEDDEQDAAQDSGAGEVDHDAEATFVQGSEAEEGGGQGEGEGESEGAAAPSQDSPPPEIVTAESQAAKEEAARVATTARGAFTVDDPNEPYQSIMKRLKEWRDQGKAR